MEQFRSTQERLRQIGWLALALAIALTPELSAAQGLRLSVTLRDAAGRGVSGITIIVRDEGGAELGRQTSDAAGSAAFDVIPPIVRVAVEGQPRGGPRLYQLGADAAGLRVDLRLSAGQTALDLRVEPDGLVLPDPASMLALEEGGPLAADASPAPSAAATPAPPPAASAPSDEGAPDGAAPQAGWVPPVTLLIVVGAVAVLRLAQKLRGPR
jgi:hypothetical protein